MRQRIVPFVDHEIGFRFLDRLIQSSLDYNFDIPAVVTTKANGSRWWPGVQEMCVSNNLPLHIYEEFTDSDFYSLQADWILLLSWKYMLAPHLIHVPKNGIINLHYSLLPRFRGVYPVNWSIIAGEKMSGFTFHFISESVDNGSIFMQVPVSIHLSDTARTLQLRIDDAVIEHFDEFIHRLLAHEIQSIQEGEQIVQKKSQDIYSVDKFRAVCALDLDASYRGIDFLNLLRGLSFFPNSRNAFYIDDSSGKKIFINLQLSDESEG